MYSNVSGNEDVGGEKAYFLELLASADLAERWQAWDEVLGLIYADILTKEEVKAQKRYLLELLQAGAPSGKTKESEKKEDEKRAEKKRATYPYVIRSYAWDKALLFARAAILSKEDLIGEKSHFLELLLSDQLDAVLAAEVVSK